MSVNGKMSMEISTDILLADAKFLSTYWWHLSLKCRRIFFFHFLQKFWIIKVSAEEFTDRLYLSQNVGGNFHRHLDYVRIKTVPGKLFCFPT